MRRWFLMLLLLLLAVGIGWFGAQHLFGPAPVAPPVVADLSSEPVATRDLLLYFQAAEGDYLEAEMRQVSGCDSDEACMVALVSELIRGSHTGLGQVLPAATKLNGLTFEEDLVQLDFSEQFTRGHPGGTQNELLTAYALIDSLAVNFSYLKHMQVAVAGQPLETIKGHLDLSAPLKVDFSFTRPHGGRETIIDLEPGYQELVVPAGESAH